MEHLNKALSTLRNDRRLYVAGTLIVIGFLTVSVFVFSQRILNLNESLQSTSKAALSNCTCGLAANATDPSANCSGLAVDACPAPNCEVTCFNPNDPGITLPAAPPPFPSGDAGPAVCGCTKQFSGSTTNCEAITDPVACGDTNGCSYNTCPTSSSGGGINVTGGATGGNTGGPGGCLCEGQSQTSQSCRSVDTKTKCGSMAGCSWNCYAKKAGSGSTGSSGGKTTTVTKCAKVGNPPEPLPPQCFDEAGDAVVTPASIIKAGQDVVEAYRQCGNPSLSTIDHPGLNECLSNTLLAKGYNQNNITLFTQTLTANLEKDKPQPGQNSTGLLGFLFSSLALAEGQPIPIVKDCAANSYKTTITVGDITYAYVGEGTKKATIVQAGDIAFGYDCTTKAGSAYIVKNVSGDNGFIAIGANVGAAFDSDLVARYGVVFYRRQTAPGAVTSSTASHPLVKASEDILNAYKNCSDPVGKAVSNDHPGLKACLEDTLTAAPLSYSAQQAQVFEQWRANNIKKDYPTAGLTCSLSYDYSLATIALLESGSTNISQLQRRCASDGPEDYLTGFTAGAAYYKLIGVGNKDLTGNDLTILPGDFAWYQHCTEPLADAVVVKKVSGNVSFFGIEALGDAQCEIKDSAIEHVREGWAFYRKQ